MNKFQADKSASNKYKPRKTVSKTVTDSGTGELLPPDGTKDADGTTSIDEILRQRLAEVESRDEAGEAGE